VQRREGAGGTVDVAQKSLEIVEKRGKGANSMAAVQLTMWICVKRSGGLGDTRTTIAAAEKRAMG
jgi:hypothetical protein